MSQPIQALAPGFLSLLGLKNQGALPPEMIDALAPVIDLSDFYLLGVRESFPVTSPVNVLASAQYSFAEFIIPSNEVWWVHAFSASVAVPAGQTWGGNLQHQLINTRPVTVGPIVSGGAAAAQNLWLPSIGNFWARGGDRFGIFTGFSTGAGATNAFGDLTISRFVS